jgi:hypothetical protein
MSAKNKPEKDSNMTSEASDVEREIREQIRDNEKMLKPARLNASHHNCRLCNTSVSESVHEEK